MKISLHIYPGRPIEEILKISKFLDDNNWHGIYLSDHFMPHKNHVQSGPMVECWTALSAIACSTKNIQLSSFVSPLSFRHPGVLANMATTVDEISKGRLILGVGAGWQQNEHESYGFDLLTPKERIDRFEEGIQVLIGLLNNSEFSFNGKFFNLDNATCEPKKYSRNIPIMIGCWTGNNRMLSIAKKYGDIINLIGGADYFNNKLSNNFKEDNSIFKNVLNYPFIFDMNTKHIIEKYNQREENKYKISPFTNYAISNRKNFLNNIEMYKNMGFKEIIIGDMSFLDNDEDLFFMLNYIKQCLHNID